MDKLIYFTLCVLIGITLSIGHKVMNLEPNYNLTTNIILDEKPTSHSYNCTLTAYSATVDQTNSDPYKTALMEKPVVGGTVAVSQDLKRYLGNSVYISGYGVFRVNDLMNKRYSNRVDLFVKDKKTAMRFGKKENVLVVFY